MLVHHADAQVDGISRLCHMDFVAVHQNLAAVRMVQAINHVHQRGLACTIFAQQGVNLALLQIETHLVVGQHAGEALGDILDFQSEVVCHGHSPFSYGIPSAAGGVVRPTMPVNANMVKRYGSMPTICDFFKKSNSGGTEAE